MAKIVYWKIRFLPLWIKEILIHIGTQSYKHLNSVRNGIQEWQLISLNFFYNKKTYVTIKLLLSLQASANVIEANSKDNLIYIMKIISKLKLLLDKGMKQMKRKKRAQYLLSCISTIMWTDVNTKFQLMYH